MLKKALWSVVASAILLFPLSEASASTYTGKSNEAVCKVVKVQKVKKWKKVTIVKNGQTAKTQTNATKVEQTTPVPQPSQAVATVASEVEKEVVRLVNVERAKQGLSALQLDEALTKVARMKSQDMQAKNYFSHTSPTYGSPFDMMKQFGISYKSAGENIAKGQRSAAEVVTAWMNSEGHRANILNASYTHIGVGYVESGHYWTQMFIKK